MVTVWLLCGYCVVTVWLLCGYCLGTRNTAFEPATVGKRLWDSLVVLEGRAPGRGPAGNPTDSVLGRSAALSQTCRSDSLQPKLPAQQALDPRGRLALACLYPLRRALGLRQRLWGAPVVFKGSVPGRGPVGNPKGRAPEGAPARNPTCRVTVFNQSSQQSRLPSKEGVNSRWLSLFKFRSLGS